MSDRHGWRLAGLALMLVIVALLGGSCAFGRGPARPAVAIVRPANGEQVTVGQAVQIESLAIDDAAVARIELWVDGVLSQTSTADPARSERSWSVSQTWTPGLPGRHSLTVKAFNRQGLASDPYTVLIEVAPASAAASVSATPTATPTILPTASPSPAPAGAACLNNAEFVSDLTVPDETRLRVGEAFEKGWRLRNSGTCAWKAGYLWVFESGAQLDAPAEVPVPPAAPGAEIDITVPMSAPAEPGRYVGRWRMQAPDGQMFGQRGTVIIVVLPPGLNPPAAPTNLLAQAIGPSAVMLSWQNASGSEQGAKVYGEDGKTVLAVVDTPLATQARIDNLPCGSDVAFIVRTYNDAGDSPPSAVVRLRMPACQPRLPVIHYFRAEPATIQRGQTARLSWDLEGAREARLFPGGESGVVAPGSLDVSPTETTTYRLVAANEYGTVEFKVTVTVR